VSKPFFSAGFGSLRFTDFVVMLAAAAITVFSAVTIYGRSSSTVQFVVRGRTESWVYPISKATRIDVVGPLGTTTVELKDGKAGVSASPCSNQTCVTSGVIHRSGQWIACLPNAVFVLVESFGEDYAEVDGTVW
jgi:hypothetical protein